MFELPLGPASSEPAMDEEEVADELWACSSGSVKLPLLMGRIYSDTTGEEGHEAIRSASTLEPHVRTFGSHP